MNRFINRYSTTLVPCTRRKFPNSTSCLFSKAFTTNLRGALDQAAKTLNITQLSDWYRVTTQEYKDLLGYQFEKDFNLSPSQLLSSVYPEHEWLPWKFSRCPKHFWDDVKNQRKFMDWAGKELKIKEMNDWYKISHEDLIALRGFSLLKLYNFSVSKLLTTVYPEYDWLPWIFSYIPQGYWSDVKNQRKFMDWAGKELKIKEMSDWYNVVKQDFIKLGGGHLLVYNNYTVPQLLSVVYPEYNWLLSKFRNYTSKGLANNSENWKLFLEYVAKELDVKELSDWYKVKAEQIIDLGGGILLVKNLSLLNILSQVYPEFKWDTNLFSQADVDIWNDKHLANYFVEWLKKQPENEVISVLEIVKETSATGTLLDLLTEAYPQFKWKGSKLAKKTQFILKECIGQLFTGKNALLLEEYKHPDISNLELDYFLPQYNLAFEYQGQQHYRNISVFHQKESVDASKERDKQKNEICKEKGITLIEVPYWWDRKFSSLAATVYNTKPDLFEEKPQGTPIPLSPPSLELLNRSKKASKEYLMTATEWDDSSMEPKGWFMTEKYDGMRLYWNGYHFYSRQGKKVQVPESIKKQLPVVGLDGELWTQYGLHQEAVSLGRSTDEIRWKKAVFWIFDAPQLENKPLEERIEFLQQLQLPSFAKVVEFVKCEGKEHLKQFNDAILKKRGEGVMLRESGSLYKPGRSTSLRKYKPFLDTEVQVIKNQYPHGFICEQYKNCFIDDTYGYRLNGKTLFVNIPNDVQETAKQVKVGSVITVKHSGMNVHGTLLYPQFYRERLDVKWNDMLNKPL